MKRLIIAIILMVLLAYVAFPVSGQVIIKATIDDSIFVTYSFENLDEVVYEQAQTEFSAETIPTKIAQILSEKNQSLLRWGLPPEPLIFDSNTRSIQASFILSGSDVISYTLNSTTMERSYTVTTDWRKIAINLTNSFSVDCARRLDTAVASWQRVNYTDTEGNLHTSYHYENKEEGLIDVSFDLILPAVALRPKAEVNVLIYNMPPRFDDLLISSPLPVLGVLVIILSVVLIIRKIR